MNRLLTEARRGGNAGCFCSDFIASTLHTCDALASSLLSYVYVWYSILRQRTFDAAWSALRLRNFHRPLVRKFARGPLAAKQEQHKFFPVASLVNHVKKMNAVGGRAFEKMTSTLCLQERERLRIEQGGVDLFWMRSASYLCGKDSELVLIEYSEQVCLDA